MALGLRLTFCLEVDPLDRGLDSGAFASGGQDGSLNAALDV